jgi:hypothetical protein
LTVKAGGIRTCRKPCRARKEKSHDSWGTAAVLMNPRCRHAEGASRQRYSKALDRGLARLTTGQRVYGYGMAWLLGAKLQLDGVMMLGNGLAVEMRVWGNMYGSRAFLSSSSEAWSSSVLIAAFTPDCTNNSTAASPITSSQRTRAAQSIQSTQLLLFRGTVGVACRGRRLCYRFGLRVSNNFP